MPFRGPEMHFADIREAGGLIEEYTAGLSLEQFLTDRKTYLAVERLFQIVTEATARLGADAELLCPGPDWLQIRQFGNILRYAYHSVRPQVIWQMVKNDLPSLLEAVNAVDRGPRIKLGVLLSGRGSNFLAIQAAIAEGRLREAEIVVVIADKADVPGLGFARELGLAALAIPQLGQGSEARAEQERKVLAALAEHGVELVCLAGYMRIISPVFVEAYRDRILNVHPSLLPSFPGLHAQRQALEYGAKVAGCTVHFVDEQVDHGVIVLQRVVPVLDDDTEETLSARILAEEHQAFAEAIGRVLSGEYGVVDRRFVRVRAVE